jgi:hypothetical protein
MLTKKITMLVLAPIVLTLVSGSVYARPRGHGFDHGRDRGRDRGKVVIAPYDHHRRLVVIRPQMRRRIVIAPTIVFSSSTSACATTKVVEDRTFTVWITNDNGSRSAVVLTKEKNGPGYIGPRGEYYLDMPTEQQLKMVYGLGAKLAQGTSFDFWIDNDNGTQTVVTLTKSGEGFIGPAGEYYATMPTEEQLKIIYGK